MREVFRINLKAKVFQVLCEDKRVVFVLGEHAVSIPEDKKAELLAVLDFVFLGILKGNTSIQGEDGKYLVFIKGHDRWGIRLGGGSSEDRQVVYLSRFDIRVLYYKLLLC